MFSFTTATFASKRATAAAPFFELGSYTNGARRGPEVEELETVGFGRKGVGVLGLETNLD